MLIPLSTVHNTFYSDKTFHFLNETEAFLQIIVLGLFVNFTLGSGGWAVFLKNDLHYYLDGRL